MRKWGMSAIAVLFLFCVAGLVYAQDGGGPGMHGGGPGGRHFGPGPGFGGGPGFGERSDFGGGRHSRGRFDAGRGPEAFGGMGFARRPYEAARPSITVAPGVASVTQSPAAQMPGAEHGFFFGRIFAAMHQGARPLLMGIILLAVIPVLIVLFWVLPVTLGVCIARRRKLSPLWMLFGIHPIGGWVACLVLALSKGKVECAKCGGYVKPNFRQCPFCEQAMASPTPPKPSA